MGNELGIAPSTVAMLAGATVALEGGMLAYAWYGFYAHAKRRHKAYRAVSFMKIMIGVILLSLLKWWLIDVPFGVKF